MKKIIYLLGLAAMFVLPSCSDDDDNNVEFVEPTISIAISNANATGCAVTYTMNDAVAYYRSTKMTQSEYSALSEAQAIAAVEAAPMSYVSSKNVKKLYPSAEYVFLAIPYTADGVAGKLATASTNTSAFSVTLDAYLSVDEAEGYDKANAIFVKIKSNGNASSGKAYLAKTSEYNTALATYSTPQSVCEALGQDIDSESLDEIADGTDTGTAEDVNGDPIDELTDYTVVVVLYDAAGTAYVATDNVTTEEIVLTAEYQQYLGNWTMNYTSTATGTTYSTLPITISINKKNKSYMVTGVAFSGIPLDFIMNFNSSDNTITMTPQFIVAVTAGGTDYYIWLCLSTTTQWTWGTSSTYVYTGTYDPTPKVTFGGTYVGFRTVLFSSITPSSAASQGYIARYYNVTFTK